MGKISNLQRPTVMRIARGPQFSGPICFSWRERRLNKIKIEGRGEGIAHSDSSLLPCDLLSKCVGKGGCPLRDSYPRILTCSLVFERQRIANARQIAVEWQRSMLQRGIILTDLRTADQLFAICRDLVIRRHLKAH